MNWSANLQNTMLTQEKVRDTTSAQILMTEHEVFTHNEKFYFTNFNKIYIVYALRVGSCILHIISC